MDAVVRSRPSSGTNSGNMIVRSRSTSAAGEDGGSGDMFLSTPAIHHEALVELALKMVGSKRDALPQDSTRRVYICSTLPVEPNAMPDLGACATARRLVIAEPSAYNASTAGVLSSVRT